MDVKQFQRALQQVAEERGISAERVIETIEAAIATAYKKDYGEKGQKIKAKFDPMTGGAQFWQVKLVVDDSMLYTPEEVEAMKDNPPEEYKEGTAAEGEVRKYIFNEEKHIMLADAKKTWPKIQVGEEIEIPLESKEEYGRIAAQTAKQVILQKIREAEKETVTAEYKSKEGEIVSGVVQRVEGPVCYVDIGRTLGVLNREEQIPGEFYRPGQRLKFYILKVEDGARGSVVLLSRSYPKLISKLFELEVPEIASGAVVIKSIAREAGFRTKIAVMSTEDGVDPVGACVGQRGTRIMAVINEIAGEKIDVIPFDENSEKYIENALAPAKVEKIIVQEKNTASVEVADDQLSLAIGRDGRNVRLASNLTGWKIDIKGGTKTKPAEKAEEKFEEAGAEIEKETEKEAGITNIPETPKEEEVKEQIEEEKAKDKE